MSKVYVDVTAYFDSEGNITPTSIVWEDGTEYDIDKVMDMRKAASLKAGGFGVRYTIRIQNKVRYLWKEENRWFVEGKELPQNRHIETHACADIKQYMSRAKTGPC